MIGLQWQDVIMCWLIIALQASCYRFKEENLMSNSAIKSPKA